MSTRQGKDEIRQGMTVYTAEGQALGTIERLQGTTLLVGGQSIARTLVARVTADGVYLDGSYAAADAQAIHVPVAEERLTVGKRAVELGEVDIRKTVVEDQQTVPVTLRHEELHVEEVGIADRPLRADDDAFNEGVITINLRGEEAVVAKEAVITGEVVIAKDAVSEERQITDTVRKQHVDVDQSTVREATTTTRETTTSQQGRKTRKG